MTILLSALAFFLLLSVLIMIHEWGHFFAARRAGVVVEEFGFGLPPRAVTLFTQGGTKFTINWIPFGGFVRLKGENAIDAREHTRPGSFGAASIPARISILCAGVFMNFLLALVILTFGFSFGKWIPIAVYTSLPALEAAAEDGLINLTLGVRIDDVVSGGGAAAVGVPEMSILTYVGDQEVTRPEDVAGMQEGKRQVIYTVLLAPEYTEEQKFTVTLSEKSEAGIVMALVPLVLEGTAQPLGTAFLTALSESWHMLVQTVHGIGQLFLSLACLDPGAPCGTVPDGISGIVGIAQYTHTTVQEGFGAYFRLVALLSLSLAALNILPLPALDGGRLLFVLVEFIQRKPVNRKFEVVTNGVGFVFLLILLVLITYHDILRLF
jgi:regulator of sigma E protease